VKTGKEWMRRGRKSSWEREQWIVSESKLKVKRVRIGIRE
jgi:hypothetical protein